MADHALVDRLTEAVPQVPETILLSEYSDSGFSGFLMSPWWASMAALEEYCDTNYESIIEEEAPEW